MTKEAIAMYLTKLRDDGILIFNLTNRYVNLAPVLADLAHEFNLVCLHQGDNYDKLVPDKFASDWVIMFPKKSRKLLTAEALLMLGTPGPGGLASVPWAALSRTPQFEWTDPLTTRLFLTPGNNEEAERFRISDKTLTDLRMVGMSETILSKLAKLKDQVFWSDKDFRAGLAELLTKAEWEPIQNRVLSKAREGSWLIAVPSGRAPWTDHFSDLIRAMRW
jgi:hypothetical protein